MKKRWLTIGLLTVLTFLRGQSTNAEFRSNWIITWEYISSSYSPAQGKARIREILDNMKAANMNAVLFQVRQSGTAYYPSSFEPWGYYAGSGNPGYNPLAYMVKEAHARGMEVHAWFNAFAAASTVNGAPASDHPEWVCRDQDGNPMTSYRALSPGLEAVRNYTVNVAMEIVNNYDIDGLHLDYVRWNEYSNNQRYTPTPEEEIRQLDGMLSDEEIEELNNNRTGRYLYDVEHPYSGGVPSGFSSWEEWWRWSVTEFVSTLHDSIQAVKPWVKLSAAVLGKYNWSGWQAYGSVFQDAALWFNEHYVDQLTPMHYHWTSSNNFYGMLVGDCPNCWSDYIQPGIAAQNIYSVGPGSYVLSDYGAWNNHPSIVNTCRFIPWVKGFQFFSYGTWESHDYWDEAGSTFFKRRTKQPLNINSNSVQPAAPALTMERSDSLNYVFTIQPADTTVPNWTILYRNDTLAADSSQNTIVDIFLTDTTVQVTESFSGTQDFNGRYSYYTTTANRFWRESPHTGLVSTDSIPSFAPVVLSANPPPGDTVRVNVRPIIVFSKTMNTDDSYSKILVNTDIGYSLLWATNHRSV
ncbi:MAG: glycoside hydrolase family 10 protein, partial [Fidelibacterota bacterium]